MQEPEQLPENWVEYDERHGELRVVASRKKNLPLLVRVISDGREQQDAERFHFIGAPFRLCLTCGVAYDAMQRLDFPKFSTLSSEGRSTATTILVHCFSKEVHEPTTELPWYGRRTPPYPRTRTAVELVGGDTGGQGNFRRIDKGLSGIRGSP